MRECVDRQLRPPLVFVSQFLSPYATRSGAATRGAASTVARDPKLEFDHIIPWSQGGSNTARNLELRCESCNRKKGADV